MSNTTGTHHDLVTLIRNAPAVRPRSYKISDDKWRLAFRTVLRGKNLMVTGPTGTGKTALAQSLAEAMPDREFFNIPLGSSQDPRSTLIGNTHYSDKSGGTYVAPALFVSAIQRPNAIILLEEVSRAHPDAWNILMSVLDYKQRFLRIDEDPNTPTVAVAPGVSVIATANIGARYTSTRTMDAAFLNRFITIEVDRLPKADELDLLKTIRSNIKDDVLDCLTSIAEDIRKAYNDQQIRDDLSTRIVIETADLIYDGFGFDNALELAVLTQFSDAGGAESDRTKVKLILQKYATPDDSSENLYQFDPNKKTPPWKTDD